MSIAPLRGIVTQTEIAMSAPALLLLLLGSPDVEASPPSSSVRVQTENVEVAPGRAGRGAPPVRVEFPAVGAPAECANAQVHRIVQQPSATRNLMLRETDEVRVYRLLERHIGTCASPISWPRTGMFTTPRSEPGSGD